VHKSGNQRAKNGKDAFVANSSNDLNSVVQKENKVSLITLN
jgi:hypothetical protein